MGSVREFVRDLFADVGVETTDSIDDGYSAEKLERWRAYEVRDPDGHGADHEAFWTSAPGVWCCWTCDQKFRTWTDEPKVDPRQGEVVSP